jgi:GNAT superfamily N-acetyltransferase
MKLLAPNGKPSNLTPEQYRLVRTPEFKAWFGDWENSLETASKVVDENGEPLVVYHGTDAIFYEFKKQEKGWETFWFSPNFATAKMYSKTDKNNSRVLKCFLNLRNPNNKYPFDILKYDGFIDYKIEMDYFTFKQIKTIQVIQVVNPNQIKLADGSNTTFDSSNPDIRFDDGGNIEYKVYHGSPIFKEKGILMPSKSGELGAGVYFTRNYKLAENYSLPRGEIKNMSDAISKSGVAELNLSNLKIKKLYKDEYLKKRNEFYDNEQKLNNVYWDLDIANKAEQKLIDYYEKEGYDGLEVDDEQQGVIFPSSIDKVKLKNNSNNSDIMFSGGGKIKFKIESREGEEDRTEISIKGIGSATLVETYPKYEFQEDLSEKEFNKLGLDEYDMIGKIEHIEVKDNEKGKGYAKLLMNKVIDVATKKRLLPLYLNASPMGTKGLGIDDLTNFYESFGFKVFKKQGNNNLMILNKKFDLGGTTMKKPKSSILLAPNGKPSNLNPKQYKLVRTPEFKAWFGDWENSPETSSKVVDENGEPLVVYHGSEDKFNIFKKEKTRFNYFYFSLKKDYADNFGKSKQFFLNCRKIKDVKTLGIKKIRPPKLFKALGFKNTKEGYYKIGYEFSDKNEKFWYYLRDSENLYNILKLNNYDCVNFFEDFKEQNKIDETEVYAVIKSNCIKLADGSNTTFDSSNPDVRFNDGGGISWNDYKNSQFNEEEHKYLPSDYFKPFEVMRNIKNKYSVLLITKDGIEYRLYNNSQNIIGAFDGEDLIGYSDNSAVEVSPKYQKRGIGLNLITLIKERNPKHRFGNMTPQGFNLMGSYYDKKIANNPDVKFDLGGTTMRKPKTSVLLAPNGKPSNLTPKQYKLVRTPEFKKWFGDWENSPETASKIIDENGEPLRVYHKTDYKFTVFDKEKLGSSSNWNTAYFGFYFSNIYERTSYGRLSIKCFLNIRNPYLIECEMYCDYDYDYKRFDESNFSKNDGIIIKTMKLGKDEKADKHFVAFEPNQIKLADGTNTEFNSNNPDIRYENGGLTLDKMLIGDIYSGVQVRNIVSKYGSSEGTDMVEFSKERIKEEDKYVLDYVSIDKLLERDIDLRTFIDSEKEYNGLGYTPNAREITEPIILGDALYSSMSNVVIDGYHRILQSIINNQKKILAFIKIDKGHDYLIYEHGGQIKDLLSSQEVEDKLGRELHWWNDDVVFIGGQKYKKVYLRPEYKRVI